jgi:hypothetical protein
MQPVHMTNREVAHVGVYPIQFYVLVTFGSSMGFSGYLGFLHQYN